MKTAVVIGHSARSQGAANKSGLTEYQYNSKVAQFVCFNNPDTHIITRTKSYSKLIEEINKQDFDLVISLHCNAFNKKASGFEILSSGSKNSLEAARIFESNIYELFEEIPLRGIKTRKLKQRGGAILHKTNAPCILLEPFFIDNDSDLKIGLREQKNYAMRIKGAIKLYEYNVFNK